MMMYAIAGSGDGEAGVSAAGGVGIMVKVGSRDDAGVGVTEGLLRHETAVPLNKPMREGPEVHVSIPSGVRANELSGPGLKLYKYESISKETGSVGGAFSLNKRTVSGVVLLKLKFPSKTLHE